MSNPGPIDNFSFLSPFGAVGCKREDDLFHKFIPIPETCFNSLQARFGGGPKLTRVIICQKSICYIDAYNSRKTRELDLITHYDTKDTGVGKYWYLVDADWVNRWKKYVKDGDVEDVRDMISPYKITNYRLFEVPDSMHLDCIRGRKNLSVKKDFMGVNFTVWSLFAHLHGVLNVHPDDEEPICKRGLYMEADDGVPETHLTPKELTIDDTTAHRISWQFVDVYHGDWESYSETLGNSTAKVCSNRASIQISASMGPKRHPNRTSSTAN